LTTINPSECIFCRILNGRAPGSFVYQDDLTAAFMDIRQPVPYRVLVIPRAHVETVYDLDVAQAEALFRTTVQVARAVRAASGCEGLNLFQNNGPLAGQDVPHVHMHILPRYPGDALQPSLKSFAQAMSLSIPDRAELDRMAAELRASLA
jgi:histidine triad (HIT) family protein